MSSAIPFYFMILEAKLLINYFYHNYIILSNLLKISDFEAKIIICDKIMIRLRR